MTSHHPGSNNNKNSDKGVDLWSQIVAIDSSDNRFQQQQQTAVVYRRKNPQRESLTTSTTATKEVSASQKNRVSLVPGKRISWNRSLFTRGRTSIAVAACVNYGPEKEKRIRKNKPPLARAKGAPPQNYDKERAYFQEVDAFDLLEESPSPKNKTWVMGAKNCEPASHLSSVVKKWLVTLRQTRSCGPSASLSRILETPEISRSSVYSNALDFTGLKTSLDRISRANTGVKSGSSLNGDDRIEEIENVGRKDPDDIESGIRNLSLSSQISFVDEPLLALLEVCGQSSSSTFSDVLTQFCDLQSIAKVGEGTYGEVFIAGETVCKVVPFDGDSLVNGEKQKKTEELLEEVILSLTLNQLRGTDNHIHNVCPTFIQTLSLRVCDGTYDDAMIRAWEKWDKKHNSQNDHPSEFTANQRFVVFVQEHGGQDLENFVLLNFNDARSLLVQVTLALAVAEVAFEFEHRDLHWFSNSHNLFLLIVDLFLLVVYWLFVYCHRGNILVSRKGTETLQFVLDGKKMHVKTYGLVASIIDFTLSRINTGEDILFLDLSLDPGLFDGPKLDIQSQTYRKMKEVTEDYWEGSFPKTNVLWLQYLLYILMEKKVYDRTSNDVRELRALKKRLNGYESARESVADPFFSDLIVSD